MQKSSQDLDSARIIGENDDVVRIMSIHKSKGLEFPVVFICGMGKNFNLRELNDPILLQQEIGFGPQFVDPERSLEYSTLAKEAIRIKSRNESIAEEMRVLYVALTRAKEKLIMVGTKKDLEKYISEKEEQIQTCLMKKKLPKGLIKTKKSYLDWILLTFLSKKEKMEKEINIIKHKAEEFEGKRNEEKEQFLHWNKEKKISKEILEKLTWEYPNTQAFQIPSKTSVTKIKQIEKEVDETTNKILLTCKLNKPKFLEEQTELTGAQKGTIMHKTLQSLNLKQNYTKNELKEHIQKMVAKKILTEKEADTIKQSQILSFINSKLADQIRKSTEIQKEKPFYLNLPAKKFYDYNENDNILIQGIIDLYFRDEYGKLVLVDYKTDYVKNENELIEKYHKQIEIYKNAIEKATAEKVDRCYIYSLYLNREVNIFT